MMESCVATFRRKGEWSQGEKLAGNLGFMILNYNEGNQFYNSFHRVYSLNMVLCYISTFPYEYALSIEQIPPYSLTFHLLTSLPLVIFVPLDSFISTFISYTYTYVIL